MKASIGIDLGANTSKIAAYKVGGSIQILTNQANFRETPSIVGFGSAQRKIGETGLNKLKANFKNSIIAPHRFCGLLIDSHSLNQQQKHNYSKLTVINNEVMFEVEHSGQKYKMIPQQITASYLGKMKQLIKNHHLKEIEFGIVVPCFFSQAQRQGILEAAQIAGIQNAKLINDSTAIVTEYGLPRKAQFDSIRGRNVLFIDFGHSKLNTFIGNFKRQQCELICSTYDRNLGVRDLDICLMNFYRDMFLRKTKIDILKNDKALIKLKDNIEKQRKILSGNRQHQMSIEYLIQEEDLQYTMKRQQMEKICFNVFGKIIKKLEEIYSFVIRNRIQLHSIQLIGGGSRIPCFIDLVKDIFRLQPSRTLNASQAIAQGCSLYLALNNPQFKMASYSILEKVQERIIISWNSSDREQFGYNSTLYPYNQKKILYEIGSEIAEKQFRVISNGNVQLLVQYQAIAPGVKNLISYTLTFQKQNRNNAFQSTIFKFGFDCHGLLKVLGCQIEEQKRSRSHRDEFGRSPYANMKRSFVNENPNKLGFDRIFGDDFRRNQPPIRKILQFQQYNPNKNSVEKIQKMKALEAQMQKQDMMFLQSYERKNKYESQIYNVREKLNDFNDLTSEEERNKWSRLLDEQSEWVNEEGQTSSKIVYQGKMHRLQDILDTLNSRKNPQKIVLSLLETLNNRIEEFLQNEHNLVSTERLNQIKDWITKTSSQLPKDSNSLQKLKTKIQNLQDEIEDLTSIKHEKVNNTDNEGGSNKTIEQENCQPQIIEE